MKKLLLPLAFIFALSFSSCDDEDLIDNLDANIEGAKAYVTGETAFFDIFKVIDKAVRDSVLWANGSVQVDGAQVSFLPGDTAMIVDYGSTNVLCPDGKNRRGAMHVSLNGDYLNYTGQLSAQLLDYYLNDDEIEGTQTLQNFISGGNYDLQMQVIGGVVTQTTGKVFNWATSRTLRWLQGALTPGDISDDKIAMLTGSTVTGNVVGGNSYDVEVANDLEYGRDCEWISKGLINITIPGLPVETGSVDFGNGECDAKVLFLFGGSSVPYFMD